MIFSKRAARYVACLSLLLSFGMPALVLAQAQCSAGQPRLAPAFADLVARLGSRVGDATECEHTDASSGDLQQSTSHGLLYLRKSTNTPTFTDGGEHWALRSGQLLDWTSTEVDPPASAQVIASAPAQPTAPPAVPAAAPVATSASIGSPSAALASISALVAAASLTVILLAIVATFGLVVLRRRPRASGWVVQPGTQLATPTGPVGALQPSIANIGDGAASAQAQDILSRDPDPTVVQVRPVALAVLFPAILKWLLVVIVALVIASALGQPVLTLVAVAVGAVALAAAYGPLSATLYRVTSQRIEITAGMMSQHTVTRESYELGDARIDKPFHYRLFGAGDLTIASREGGVVVLRAIPNADVVRDLIRGSGQFEAARFEKARWR
jgi:hypothetical protein